MNKISKIELFSLLHTELETCSHDFSEYSDNTYSITNVSLSAKAIQLIKQDDDSIIESIYNQKGRAVVEAKNLVTNGVYTITTQALSGVYQNIDDMFCKTPSSRYEEPQEYYLLNSKDLILKDNINDIIVNDDVFRYRKILKFINMLTNSAIRKFNGEDEKESAILLYVGHEQFEIIIDYDFKSTPDIDLSKMIDLCTLFEENKYLTEKKQILSKALENVIKELGYADNIFVISDLFILFDLFSRQFNVSYKLFTSGFSFDSFSQEMRDKRGEFTKKINDIFASIQGKLLAIPLTAAAAIASLKPLPQNEYVLIFISNLAILIGVFIFCLMLTFALKNQRHTLQAVWADITDLKNTLNDVMSNVVVDIMTEDEKQNNKLFQSLQERYNLLYRGITGFLWVTWLLFTAVLTCWFCFSFKFC